MVVPRSDDVPRAASAQLETIAVRCPEHAVARELLEAFGGPISAPSANRSGHVSPTAAAHVRSEFPDAGELIILDGGSSEAGLESTVIDVSDPDGPIRILRPGHVTEGMLRGGGFDVVCVDAAEQGISPGTRASHYAPEVPTELVDAAVFAERVAELADDVAVLCFAGSAVGLAHRVEMPGDAGSYARRLYDALRQAESMPVSRILIERWSDEDASADALWVTIADRLRRACAPRES